MYKITRFQIYLILFAALFLQGGVLNYVKIFGAKPDLLVIAVIFFGLFLGPAAVQGDVTTSSTCMATPRAMRIGWTVR